MSTDFPLSLNSSVPAGTITPPDSACIRQGSIFEDSVKVSFGVRDVRATEDGSAQNEQENQCMAPLSPLSSLFEERRTSTGSNNALPGTQEASPSSVAKEEATPEKVVFKHLGFPSSWDHANKADRRLVGMKEKGHPWRNIISEYQKSIGRYVKPETLKTRFGRLMQLRDKTLCDSEKPTTTSPDCDPRETSKAENWDDIQALDGSNNDNDKCSDDDSVNELSDEPSETSSEDEGPLALTRNRHPKTKLHQDDTLTDRASQLQLDDEGRDPAVGIDSAIDPEKMLTAMQEGEKRWPIIREAWEKATDWKTLTSDLVERGMGPSDEADVSLL